MRTIPSEGRIIAPITETHIDEVLEMGCWTPVIRTSLEANEKLLSLPNSFQLMAAILKYSKMAMSLAK